MKNLNLSSNVWKLYLIKAVRSGMFAIPIIVLFFKENGLSMKEILLLQSFFSIVAISLELPTGRFADCVGRKASILIGGIMATVGYVIYSMSYSFWGFLCAEAVLGVGLSFVSGADNAMLYDTLMERDAESEYKKFQGKNDSIGKVSEGITSFIGGFLALVSLRFPLYWDAGLAFLMVPLALTLTEPKIHKTENKESVFVQMWKLLKFSLNDHKELKWLIFYSAIVSASTLTMVWFIQVYWVATNVPLTLFGVLWAVLQFSAAFFSWHAHRIEKYLGRKKSLLLLIVFPVVGYFILSTSLFIWLNIFMLLFYVTVGINNPVISDYINGLVSSDVRASILSVKNLIGRLAFSVIGPFVGWINDAISLQAALAVSGLIFLLSGAIALLFMRKHKAL
ncbi:MAG TPA: MFS transporter [Candidatus Moranbacteria bacterium]|nr:MFS transporter [Candidatus Moranbacteria bacterium]HRY27881.1 MFS transporter [Candidatus Moranbacteria bacterium]HSA08352.1 MFS transporter [Candidatus Moranbacteria bacterium]